MGLLLYNRRELLEKKLMSEIELYIHAFAVAEAEQMIGLGEGRPRTVQYVTLRSALASDVIDTVRKHDYEQRKR